MRKVEELGLSECVLRHPSFSFFALCVFFAVYCLPVQAKLDSIVASGVGILKSEAYIGSSPQSAVANLDLPMRRCRAPLQNPKLFNEAILAFAECVAHGGQTRLQADMNGFGRRSG
jgi:hypothetical protein